MVNWAQIFTDKRHCFALSIFRIFILFHSLDNDNEDNEAHAKDSPIENSTLNKECMAH